MWWLLLVSDILSVITIVLCLVLKLPQIIQLLKSGHTAGLSLNGLLLELTSYTITMMYNYTNQYAVLTYLEYPVIIIQEYILIGCVMHLNKVKPFLMVAVFVSFIGITFAFSCGILNKFILTLLLPLTLPLSTINKVMQLTEIISKKNADSVSILSWFLSLFTNVTRIYTVLLDSADVLVLMNFSLSSLLSGAVMVTALYYQRLSRKKIN